MLRFDSCIWAQILFIFNDTQKRALMYCDMWTVFGGFSYRSQELRFPEVSPGPPVFLRSKTTLTLLGG